MKKKSAITLIEIVISTTIISLLLVAGFGMIAKHSKVLKASSNQKDLTLICHKDLSGTLYQTTIKQDGTKETIGTATCELKIPIGYTEYRITLIGGGAGGSVSGFDYTNTDEKDIIITPFEKTAPAYTPNEKTESEDQEELIKTCIKDKTKQRYIFLNGFSDGSKKTLDNKLESYGISNSEAKAIYNQVPILIKSGSNTLANETDIDKIVHCEFKLGNYLNFGDEYYYFDGNESFECDGDNEIWIGASAGYFKNITKNKEYYTKIFKSDNLTNLRYSNIFSQNECSTGLLPIPMTPALENEYNKIKLDYKRLKINEMIQGVSGQNGNIKGPFVVSDGIIAGKTLTIQKNDVGDGGKAGKPCENTGTNCKNNAVGTNGGDTKLMLNGLMWVAAGGKADITTQTNITENNISTDLPQVALPDNIIYLLQNLQETDEYIAKNYTCIKENESNSDNCKDSIAPKKECFGCGGIGSQAYLYSDKPYLSYKASYKGGYTEKSNTNFYNLSKSARASDGMGGAIIVQCKN